MPGDVTNHLFKSGVRGGRGAPIYQEGGVGKGTQGAGWVGQIQTRNGVFPKSCRSQKFLMTPHKDPEGQTRNELVCKGQRVPG